jgi:hypothetical protein
MGGAAVPAVTRGGLLSNKMALSSRGRPLYGAPMKRAQRRLNVFQGLENFSPDFPSLGKYSAKSSNAWKNAGLFFQCLEKVNHELC